MAQKITGLEQQLKNLKEFHRSNVQFKAEKMAENMLEHVNKKAESKQNEN